LVFIIRIFLLLIAPPHEILVAGAPICFLTTSKWETG